MIRDRWYSMIQLLFRFWVKAIAPHLKSQQRRLMSGSQFHCGPGLSSVTGGLKIISRRLSAMAFANMSCSEQVWTHSPIAIRPDLQVFEVDHPATQKWKRELALSNGLSEPSCLHYVPVDFESQNLAQRLAICGLDFSVPTFFAWLGVVLYLTRPAFRTTLDLITRFPEGSGVIFDYALPRQALAPHELEARDALSARVQSIGEPFQLFFTPEEIKIELTQFQRVEDLDTGELNARYFANRTDRLNLLGRSANIVSAWR